MIIDEAMEGEKPQPGMPLALATDDRSAGQGALTMQQYLDAPLTVAGLAARLGVRRRKLERHFREALGGEPVGRRRGSSGSRGAAELLEISERSVTEIANDTGFADVSHLIRVFRASEGETPEVWRRARRAAGQSGL